jgi:23S rRNA (pseudouridine1915-N3)-methyltransferase
MKLQILAIGRLKSGPERDLCARYHERGQALARGLGLSGPDIVEIPESRARRAEDRKAEELAAIAARLASGALVLLDERGKPQGSEALAARIGAWRDAGQPATTFVIGGADGLDPALRDRAEMVLSFGAATIPHQLVRVLVLEQLYRTMTILSGHPYHRI